MVKTHRHCPRKGCDFSGSISSSEFSNHKHCQRIGCKFVGSVKAFKDHIHCLYPACNYIGTADDDNIKFVGKGTKPAGLLGFSQHNHCEQCEFVGSNEELLEHYQSDIDGHDQTNKESFHLFLRNKKSSIESLADYTTINLADIDNNLEELKQHLSVFYYNFASKLEQELLNQVISPLLSTLYPYQLDSLEFRRFTVSKYLDTCKYVDFKQTFYKISSEIEVVMNQYGYISEEELSQQLFLVPIDLMVAQLVMKLCYTRYKYFICPECKYHLTDSQPDHLNLNSMQTCSYTGGFKTIVEYLHFRETTKPVRVDPEEDPVLLDAPDALPSTYNCTTCDFSTNLSLTFFYHNHCSLCDYVDIKSLVKRHLSNIHNIAKHNCNTCDFTANFIVKFLLHNHCKLCDFIGDKNEIKRHLLDIHNIAKLNCHSCNFATNNNSLFHSHNHCNQCKFIGNKSEIKKHIYSEH